MRIVLIAVLIAVAAVAAENEQFENYGSTDLHNSHYTVEELPSHELLGDGYRYKSVRALKYRTRRQTEDDDADADADAPPKDDDNADVGAETDKDADAPPTDGGEVEETPDTSAGPPLGQGPPNGYRYKTLKRIRYKRRKRQSDDDGKGYLPPFEDSSEKRDNAPNDIETDDINRDSNSEEAEPTTPSTESTSELAETEASERPAARSGLEGPLSADFGEDGYRYRTLRRIRYKRRRRQTQPGYLPPVGYLPADAPGAPPPKDDEADAEGDADAGGDTDTKVEDTDTSEAPPTDVGPDGYRYKTQRRIRYKRRRRDTFDI